VSRGRASPRPQGCPSERSTVTTNHISSPRYGSRSQ
jgi:hypothetical protein